MLAPRLCAMTFDMGSQGDVYHLEFLRKVRMDSRSVDIVLLVKSFSLVTIVGLKQVVEECRRKSSLKNYQRHVRRNSSPIGKDAKTRKRTKIKMQSLN